MMWLVTGLRPSAVFVFPRFILTTDNAGVPGCQRVLTAFSVPSAGANLGQRAKQTTQDWRFLLTHPSFLLPGSLSPHRDNEPVPSVPPSILARAGNFRWQGIPVRPRENGTLPRNQSGPKTVCSQRQ